MNAPTLTTAQLDRAVGVLLGTAAGDAHALGAGYEFGPPLSATTPVAMIGGGTFGWGPGEWTDDTSMAWVIAAEAATGTDLRTPKPKTASPERGRAGRGPPRMPARKPVLSSPPPGEPPRKRGPARSPPRSYAPPPMPSTSRPGAPPATAP